MPPTLPVTHRTVVTEDQIDHLGHMNVRFYGVAARAATEIVAGRLARSDGDAPPAVRFPDVYTRHLREQLLGARLSVRSGVLERRPTTARLYHELVNDDTGDLAASFVHRLEVRDGDPVDLTTGLVGDLALSEIPERGRPRSIDLGRGEHDPGPGLDLVIERGLALRQPREVQAAEAGRDGRVRAEDAHMLLWGGVPIEPMTGPMLHPGPDGQMIGWAAMENRLRVRRLPRVGDHIQAFGAVLSVADKTTHRIMWAFDTAVGDLLCAFEVVDLAFDTVSRRAVSIPDDLRASAEARLQADLRPGG